MPAGLQPGLHTTPNDCEVAARRLPWSARAARRAGLSIWAACATLLCAKAPARAAPDLARPPLPMIATLPPVRQPLPVAELQSIFHISKSENRNQVHYGASVDANCRPIGAAPIYAYWRMLERGPTRTEALLDREQPGYGLAAQQVVTRTNHGGTVRVQLRAWPDRAIRIDLFRAHKGCGARAQLDIQHQPAVIQSIYIDIGFLFSINYAQVRGIRVTDGHPVQEKLRR